MLIKCPECGKEISSEALSCPHCGFPIKNKPTKTEKYSEDDVKRLAKEKKEYDENINAVKVLFFILLAIAIIFLVFCIAFSLPVFEILCIIVGTIAVLCLAIGLPVNITKRNNRQRIIDEYKKNHPDFKE